MSVALISRIPEIAANYPPAESPKAKNEARTYKPLTLDRIQQLARTSIDKVLNEYTFAEKHNPYATEAQDKSIEWATKFGLVTDPKMIAGFRNERFAIFASNSHPNAKREQTLVICDFASLLFRMDDYIEPIEDDKGLSRLFDIIDKVCLNPAGSENHESPLVRAIGDIIKRIDELSIPMWKQRFHTGLMAHVHSTLWERGNIQLERHPPIKEYMEIRLDTSATPLSFNMVEFETGRYIPEEVFNNPAFQHLRKIAANCTNIQNDMISLKKEWKDALEMQKAREAEGKTGKVVMHNLVAILINQDVRDVDDETKLKKALAISSKLLKQNLDAFYSFKVTKEDFGDYTDLVQGYYDSLKDWTASYFIWSSKCLRYGGPGFGNS